MKKNDIRFLVYKYRNEGLKGKEIFNRLKEHFDNEDYIKFAKKYLKRYI